MTTALMQPGGLHVLSTPHGDRCPVLAEAPAHPHCTGKGGSFLQLWANGSMSLNTTLWAGKRGHLERVVNFCYSPVDLYWYMSMWFAHSCKKEQPLSVKWGWAGASAIEQKGWNLKKQVLPEHPEVLGLASSLFAYAVCFFSPLVRTL